MKFLLTKPAAVHSLTDVGETTIQPNFGRPPSDPHTQHTQVD